MSWRDHAACAGMGPEVFHAVDPRPAIDVCAGCPRWVRQACYRDAKANEVRDATAGVYGGVAAHVRAKLTEGYRVPLMVGVLSTADRDATPAQQRSVAYPRPPHKAMFRAERLAERLAAEVVGMHYGCPDCPKVFSSAAGLEVHIGMKHQAA
mgnify:FL=1